MIKHEPRIAYPAAMLADPTRETIAMTLMDGRAYTSKELASLAGISPQTASAHLAKMVAAGILSCHRQGRHAYYRIAGADVAAAIEALAQIAPFPASPAGKSPYAPAFVFARHCYDHLAGRLGVALAERVESLKLVRSSGLSCDITPYGAATFRDLGIDVDGLNRQRRPLLKLCIDCTERRPHLAGGLGAALLDRFLTENWLAAAELPRTLRLTESGRDRLSQIFNLDSGLLAAA